MNLLDELLLGKKLLFYHMDTDTWSYNQGANVLEQWVSGSKTGNYLNVISLDNQHITFIINDEEFTLASQHAIIVD
jgi:hypothetical protein